MNGSCESLADSCNYKGFFLNMEDELFLKGTKNMSINNLPSRRKKAKQIPTSLKKKLISSDKEVKELIGKFKGNIECELDEWREGDESNIFLENPLDALEQITLDNYPFVYFTLEDELDSTEFEKIKNYILQFSYINHKDSATNEVNEVDSSKMEKLITENRKLKEELEDVRVCSANRKNKLQDKTREFNLLKEEFEKQTKAMEKQNKETGKLEKELQEKQEAILILQESYEQLQQDYNVLQESATTCEKKNIFRIGDVFLQGEFPEDNTTQKDAITQCSWEVIPPQEIGKGIKENTLKDRHKPKILVLAETKPTILEERFDISYLSPFQITTFYTLDFKEFEYLYVSRAGLPISTLRKINNLNITNLIFIKNEIELETALKDITEVQV